MSEPPAEFDHNYRNTFRWTLGAAAAIVVVLAVVVAIFGAAAAWGALTVVVLFGILIAMFLATTAIRVTLRDKQIFIRTGLGRSHTAALYDVQPHLKVVKAGRAGASRQLTLRLPGQRYGITVPRYPEPQTLRLIAALRSNRPELFG